MGYYGFKNFQKLRTAYTTVDDASENSANRLKMEIYSFFRSFHIVSSGYHRYFWSINNFTHLTIASSETNSLKLQFPNSNGNYTWLVGGQTILKEATQKSQRTTTSNKKRSEWKKLFVFCKTFRSSKSPIYWGPKIVKGRWILERLKKSSNLYNLHGYG